MTTPGGEDTPSEPPVAAPPSTSSASTEPPPPPPPNLDPGEKGKDVPDALASTLVGTYAMRMKVATVQDVPILGKSSSTSVAYGTAVVERKGTGLTITEVGCHVDIEGTSSVTTVIPDAVARSVPPQLSELRAWDEAGTVMWARPSSVVAVGVKLTNPLVDPLPKDSNDGRVWDQDKDGKPGVTVKVSGFASGDIYVVQRQRSTLAGKVEAGALAGLVSDTSEQSVIGSSNPVLNQNISTTPDTDASKSNVVLVKEKSNLTCDDLLARKSAIFAGR